MTDGISTKGEEALHGPEETFQFLHSIAPAIPFLQAMKKKVHTMLGAAARGNNHTTPSKDADVKALSKAYALAKLHVEKAGRKPAMKGDEVQHIVANGLKKILEKNAVSKWWGNRGMNAVRSTQNLFDDDETDEEDLATVTIDGASADLGGASTEPSRTGEAALPEGGPPTTGVAGAERGAEESGGHAGGEGTSD